MLRFFDCDMGVGGSGQGLPAHPTPAAAVAWMDRYHIDKALVYDRAAMEAGIFDRFDEVVDFCAAAKERLIPSVPTVPPGTGECPPPDEFAALLLERGIKGVRVWPEYHAFDFDPFTFGPLLEALQRHRLPVFVHLSEAHHWQRRAGWREVRETALAFPKLPIVVLWGGMRDGRRFFPLLDGCPNVLCDLTCMTFQYIEYVAEQWGTGQLIFASHHPRHDAGVYATWVNYCGLDGEGREDLAWRNAARLMEGIR
jgi:predicted TIM-barrel fold metal-dependent hydrolase